MSTFVFILLLLAIGALFVFKLWHHSPQNKGEVGEAYVSGILSHLPEEYNVLNDVVLKTFNGTTQIDHIVVSKYGLFAIETKNYRGDIYGNDNRQEWTQIIVTDVTYRRKWYKTYTYVTKSHFYNPVKQSLSHTKAIKRVLHNYPNLTIVPIIVFAGDANLNNVNSEYHVILDDYLLSTIQSYATQCISDVDVERITNTLKESNVRDVIGKDAHIRNVKAAQRIQNDKISSGICPNCGGELVLRKGKYGVFYGCSNYPKCKFTMQ